nr:IS1595 family transposase [Paeniglutamicibacter psychrophenolicus]
MRLVWPPAGSPRVHAGLIRWLLGGRQWAFSRGRQHSAQTLQHTTGLGSYQTARAMLQNFRLAMDPSAHGPLTGNVEVDETFIGGPRPMVRGRGASGKTLVAGAVERRGRGMGRTRLQIIPDASAPSLTAFLKANVAPGAHVISDGWSPYRPACKAAGLRHTAHSIRASGQPAHVLLPWVHRLFSLVKRVLDDTYQGGAQPYHLQAYLDEFVFRFKRRHSAKRGLLFYRRLKAAVAGAPVSYGEISGIHRQPRPRSVAPQIPHELPWTLAGPPALRPWRTKIP